MKGLKKVSEATKGINYASRIGLYYSIEKDTVYTTSGEGRHHITYLIRENTPEDIKEAVERFMRL